MNTTAATSPNPQPQRLPMGGLAPDSPEAALFSALRPLRWQLAAEHDVRPYIVLSDASLADLVCVRPANRDVLMCVKGVGPAKADKFGPAMLAWVRQESARLGLALTEEPSVARHRSDAAPLASGAPSLDAVRHLAHEAFARGDALGDICVALDRAPRGLVEMLIDFAADNGLADLEPWLSEQTLADIEAAAAEFGWAKLQPIHTALGGAVPYSLLRLAQGFVAARRADQN